MARGRHRVSAPLHRLLPSLILAGAAAAVAAAAWCVPAGVHLLLVERLLTAAAAVVACAGALLLRRWDRSAGRTVTELTTAAEREEWRVEERLAELEGEAEEAREARHRAEAELRARRTELARLRGEHAALLRRYAQAETERASVLESRRRLALEAATAPRAIAAPEAALTPAAFHRAALALRDLPRNAARQQAQRTVAAARRREAASPEADESSHARHGRGRTAAPHQERTGAEHLVPAVPASAVLPYARPPRPANRTVGGFDFFGTQRADRLPVQHDGRDAARPAEPEVIDLTPHDETEQLDVRELRAHG